MRTAMIAIVLAAAAVAAYIYLSEDEATNTPQKIACSSDQDCAVKVTDCTCGGPILSCVSREYPQLECDNGSFTCGNKRNPPPDSCACINGACVANSCDNICGDWKRSGYSRVLENVELLESAGCCGGVSGCTDRCAGGKPADESDLSCETAKSPAEYARTRCKGYVSDDPIKGTRLPLILKQDSELYSLSCFYAGEQVLGEYAFSYNGRFCELDPAGMGFLFAPVGAEEAIDYYLFAAHNLSTEKEERRYELVADLPAFANRTGCNATRAPPADRATLNPVPGGFNISLVAYLPEARQAVFENAVVYRNGNIERGSAFTVLVC